MSRAAVRVAQAPTSAIQAKMTVTAVNDPAEIEADQVADQVVASIQSGLPAAALAAPAAAGVARSGPEEDMLQGKRAIARSGPEEELQGKRAIARSGPEEDMLQGKRAIARGGVPINDDQHLESEADTMGAKALERAAREAAPGAGAAPAVPGPVAPGPEGGDVPADLEQQIASAAGGQSLPDAVRSQMEQGFGADFSGVKVHLNSALAPRLGALAFAQGSEVHFAPGQFNPASAAGQHLIAHELTHVVQQGGAVAREPNKRPAEAPAADGSPTKRPKVEAKRAAAIGRARPEEQASTQPGTPGGAAANKSTKAGTGAELKAGAPPANATSSAPSGANVNGEVKRTIAREPAGDEPQVAANDSGAAAYAQGSNINVAPGQESHLPHEAWHVVQQAQGRVKPTKKS